MLRQKDFNRSMRALAAAFATEDPSLGGCEDVGGPNHLMEGANLQSSTVAWFCLKVFCVLRGPLVIFPQTVATLKGFLR